MIAAHIGGPGQRFPCSLLSRALRAVTAKPDSEVRVQSSASRVHCDSSASCSHHVHKGVPQAPQALAKTRNRTAAQQAAWEAEEAADAPAWEAAARRARRGCRASSDPLASDEELILPLPSTGLEVTCNHLTGRCCKTTLVLVVLLATVAIGSRDALWRRERLL
jgi:hypothetical protein